MVLTCGIGSTFGIWLCPFSFDTFVALVCHQCTRSSPNNRSHGLPNRFDTVRNIDEQVNQCHWLITFRRCVLTGADLFTSYTLYSPVALLHRRITILDLLKTWVVSFFGNLAGMLFFTIVLVGYGGIFSSGYYETESINYAITKAVTPQWHQIFLRGIICNWLVALAVFLAVSSREIFSKILAIWFPVMCFVGIGTDHVSLVPYCQSPGMLTAWNR